MCAGIMRRAALGCGVSHAIHWRTMCTTAPSTLRASSDSESSVGIVYQRIDGRVRQKVVVVQGSDRLTVQHIGPGGRVDPTPGSWGSRFSLISPHRLIRQLEHVFLAKDYRTKLPPVYTTYVLWQALHYSASSANGGETAGGPIRCHRAAFHQRGCLQ